MKYTTKNETTGFDFGGSVIAEAKQMIGYFYMLLDDVRIKPENSCNRDIREMRTNNLNFTITNGQITALIEEGYKVYDANEKLVRQEADKTVPQEEYNEVLKSVAEGSIYSLEKKENEYIIDIDTEEHNYHMIIAGTEDIEEWDRFLTLE
ncbi:MAG: subtilin biosynthesis sensor protein SpaK [Lachnospiraceae bacterium]|nr:subtilin biosynthesis sensor protein SpaK [Lachnospiraceae bacterium]